MKRWLYLLLAVVIALSIGCGIIEIRREPTGGEPTYTPIVAPGAPDAGLTETAPQGMVAVNLWVQGQSTARPELPQGSDAQLIVNFQPVMMKQQVRPDGSLLSTSWEAWPDHPVTEMRVCILIYQACTPDGPWQEFQSELTISQPVDWLGSATLYLAAEFRAADGSIVPSAGLNQSEPGSLAQVTLDVIANVGSATPASPQLQTALAATQSAFPVSGSVLIEDGRCCAGGKAGDTTNLTVAFKANSPAGAVTEMRVQPGGGCLRDAPALDAPWEPFAAVRSYPVGLALNWVGFYLNVQYRDSAGNLSPVYCDDISLEGSP